jgi:hypothetical protein
MMAFPREKPADPSLEVIAGALADLAIMAGFELVECLEEDCVTFWNSVSIVKDSVLGAWYCLRTDQPLVGPVDNVPTEQKLGWDFALWYALNAYTKLNSCSDYLRPRRVTSLTSTEKKAWGSDAKYSYIIRITSLIRQAAESQKHRLASPKKFLKGEGYFLEKFVGKKPSSGLYLEDELTVLVEHWERKRKHVSDRYKSIGDTWNSTCPGTVGAFGSYISGYSLSTPSNIKIIEDARNKRASLLLISTRRGRNSVQNIAKGSTLIEKLRNCGGGDSVRTIANVLWSPVWGISTLRWTELILSNAQAAASGEPNYRNAIITEITRLSNNHDVSSAQAIERAMPVLTAAIELYLEILPDRVSESSWKAAFAAIH